MFSMMMLTQDAPLMITRKSSWSLIPNIMEGEYLYIIMKVFCLTLGYLLLEILLFLGFCDDLWW